MMKQAKFFFLITLFFSGSVFGQDDNKAKIIGAWTFEKVSLANPANTRDSIEMVKSSRGIILQFKEENIYETGRKINGVMRKVEDGSYSFSADGKKILQNDEEAEILVLSGEELVFKVADGIMLHYRKTTL